MTTEMVKIGNAKWQQLRSDIYIRDKGLCWICNEFVDLGNYDLGHLFDRCNGGSNSYDNLAVMHHSCNIKKPRHYSLDEAKNWRASPNDLPTPISVPIEQTNFRKSASPIWHNKNKIWQRSPIMPIEDKRAIRQLIIEYFQKKPELLKLGHHNELHRAISELSLTLEISKECVYYFMRAEGLYQKEYNKQLTGAIKPKDNLYFQIYEHLDELLKTYNSLSGGMLTRARIMKMNRYQMSIMFYLAGIKDYLYPKDLKSIQPTVARLGLTLRASNL